MQYEDERRFATHYSRLYSPLMDISDRLEQAMKAAKFKTQGELAEASGVTQATISRILNRRTDAQGPESETVKRLAKACHVTFEWLNEGVGDTKQILQAAAETPKAKSANDFAEELIDLIRGYKEGDDTDRSIMLEAARNVLDRRRRRPKSAAND